MKTSPLLVILNLLSWRMKIVTIAQCAGSLKRAMKQSSQ